ncbi:hypothetical protein, partial [Marilutibacter maris]|uniref:hypothetical protein n=1 Tax=Marilutibacter maris TaxID=1605891 RepID=UPI001B86B205
MKSVALTPVLLVCFLAACGKPETAASASQPEGKPDAPVAGHTPKPKAARNVPLEQYVEVSNGIYSLGSTSKCNTPISGRCHVQNLPPPERRRARL